MKRFLPVLALLCLTACSGDDVSQTGGLTVSVEGNVPAMERPPEDDNLGHNFLVDFDALPSSDIEGVDIDLTQMSASMVYAVVERMLFYPEEYLGLTFRIHGTFFLWENPMTGQVHYSCVVEDALACCQQGLEFLVSDATYPDDYPQIQQTITVIGELQLYQGDGYENIHLINAQWSP